MKYRCLDSDERFNKRISGRERNRQLRYILHDARILFIGTLATDWITPRGLMLRGNDVRSVKVTQLL
jgi:hypothetical protein